MVNILDPTDWSCSLHINLCTCIQVSDIKKELAGLGTLMEDMRGTCKQLQSQMKKFPDCSETPFEAEAGTLMDTWLDVNVYALCIYQSAACTSSAW